MTELLIDDNISIRPADKGLGIVIMNTGDYIKSVECELNNTDTYEEVKHNKIIKLVKEVKDMQRDYTIKALYQKNFKKYMQPHNARTDLARGNPKMHKENHPMRMIVSAIDNPAQIIFGMFKKVISIFDLWDCFSRPGQGGNEASTKMTTWVKLGMCTGDFFSVKTSPVQIFNKLTVSWQNKLPGHSPASCNKPQQFQCVILLVTF